VVIDGKEVLRARFKICLADAAIAPAVMLKGLMELCQARRIARGYLATKALDDFGPMRGSAGAAEGAVAGADAGLMPALRRRAGPAAGPGRAVGPAGRLRCDARVGVAPPNSRRSLRSLSSDNGGESVYEARCARRPRRCASRRPQRPRSRACAAAAGEAIAKSVTRDWNRDTGLPPALVDLPAIVFTIA
jgi:hypothetical protein